MLKNIIKIVIIQILIAVLSIVFLINFSPSPECLNSNLHSATFYNGILNSVIYILYGMLLIDQKSKLNNFFSVFRGYILLSILTLIIPKDLSFLLFSFILMVINPSYFQFIFSSNTTTMPRPYFFIYLFICMLLI